MPIVFWTDALESVKNRSVEALWQPLSEADCIRAKRYRQPLDAHQFVLGRLLLGYALQQEGIGLKALSQLLYEAEGKPYLKQGGVFSIAHSRGVVACAWASTGALGLDVEVPQPLYRTHFRHCFTDAEWAAIQADASLDTFYHYWTAKEAVLKAQGWGLGHLQDVQIETEQAVSIEQQHSPLIWESMKLGEARACLCQTKRTATPLKLQFIDSSVLQALG